MSSRYASSSSSPYGYEPISPPWSQGTPPPSSRYDEPPRAPIMPYVALPDFTPYTPASPHHGLITPPPTPRGEMHPCLVARTTVVRYDFARDPRAIRMSSACRTPFPATEPAAQPTLSHMYIECEVSGRVITIHNDGNPRGITCYDVLSQLHDYFYQPLPPSEWQHVRDPQQRHNMKLAFGRRTAGSPEPYPTMRMIDYLQGQTVFKRFVVKRNDRSGSTFLLQTTS